MVFCCLSPMRHCFGRVLSLHCSTAFMIAFMRTRNSSENNTSRGICVRRPSTRVWGCRVSITYSSSPDGNIDLALIISAGTKGGTAEEWEWSGGVVVAVRCVQYAVQSIPLRPEVFDPPRLLKVRRCPSFGLVSSRFPR